MQGKPLQILTAILLATVAFSPRSSAQFKTEAFSQNYNNDPNAATSDTTKSLFSFKEYFGALGHKNEIPLGKLFGGSAIFIGGQQIYNRQYWKLPVIYGGIGATAGFGFHYKSLYDKSVSAYDEAYALDPQTSVTIDEKAKTLMTIMFAGTAALYWGSLLDGAISYKSDIKPDHGKATVYSILCPGLGQIYNGETWKVPIYWGCIMGGITFWTRNQDNYLRYKRIYIEASDPETYTGKIPKDTALYYRDLYRRYRDYSILATAVFYLLQVIDANVFSYMQNFEVEENISLSVSPTVLSPGSQICSTGNGTGLGLSLGLHF